MFDPSSTILVVDDMKTMRKLILKSCRDLGFSNFVEAADGNEAWNTLNEMAGKVDFVISDWNMPNCTGLEFLKKVRADQKFAAMPFVLLTAESEAKQVIEAQKAGVSNYIVKPFTTATLEQKLKQVYQKVSAAAA